MARSAVLKAKAELDRIVRALAAASPPIDTEFAHCHLCEVGFFGGGGHDPSHHDPACPWRLAREWVDSHPARSPAAARGEG